MEEVLRKRLRGTHPEQVHEETRRYRVKDEGEVGRDSLWTTDGDKGGDLTLEDRSSQDPGQVPI